MAHRSGEEGAKTLLPEGEYLFNVAPHEEPIHQCAATRAVTYVVHAQRPAVPLLKGVGVMPERIRTAALHIHELMRRIPRGDLGPPADGHAMNADAVVHEGAGTHLDGRGCKDFKVQPRWRDGFKVVGVREKSKYLGGWAGQPKFGVESELFQGRRAGLITSCLG